MNINEKLARWRGLENVRPTRLSNGTIVIIYNSNEIVPDYLNDDAAAMSLLDTLVKKGYNWKLEGYHNDNTWFEINKPYDNRTGDWTIAGQWKHTRREAVVTAVLELIEKEKKDGV